MTGNSKTPKGELGRVDTKAATQSGYWRATNTTTMDVHLDFREIGVKTAILCARLKGWRGYLHQVCVLRILDELPSWLVVVKPRGNWKCALCKQHAPPQELAA